MWQHRRLCLKHAAGLACRGLTQLDDLSSYLKTVLIFLPTSHQADAVVRGLVLNDIDMNKRRYGYGYSYGYKYAHYNYQHYGCGQESAGKSK